MTLIFCYTVIELPNISSNLSLAVGKGSLLYVLSITGDVQEKKAKAKDICSLHDCLIFFVLLNHAEV